MQSIEYVIVNGQKGVFFGLWIGQGRNTLYQNQKYDAEFT
jgi:hypothetical protein